MTSKVDEMIAFTYANDLDGYCADAARRFGPTCEDCSGWDWLCFHHVGVELPKSDTAGFTAWAHDKGYLTLGRPNPADLEPGDILIHDEWGNPFRSSGPRGHTGWVAWTTRTYIYTSESASGKHGVGIYPRLPGFWCARIRVPGMNDPVGRPPASPPAPPAPIIEEPIGMVSLIDRNGVTHLAHVDDAGKIQSKWNDGHGWQGDVAATGADTARKAELVGWVDAANVLHFATPASDGGVVHAFSAFGRWNVELLGNH